MKVILLGANNPHNAVMLRAISLANTRLRYEGRLWGAPRPELSDFYGWLDDTRFGEFRGLPIFGGLSKIPEMVADGFCFANTISGSTAGRYATSKAVVDAGGMLIDFIHPETERKLSGKAFQCGEGAYMQDCVDVQGDVQIGQNCAVHARAFISHECRIGHSCFIGAGVLAGRVTMQDGSFLGINATVLPDLTVGKWSIVGAGAVVTKDVPPYSVVVGNPARVIREVESKYDSGAIR